MDQGFLTRHFLHSSTPGPRQRIGVLLDGDVLSTPEASVLQHVTDADYADLVVRIYNASPEQPRPSKKRSLITRAFHAVRDARDRRTLFWSQYVKLDARLAAAERQALKPVDLSGLLRDVPRLDVLPVTKGFVHRFPAETIETIRKYDLDVLLRFGFNILKGDVLNVARYGVWSYHHGDNDFYRGGPAHFWELTENNPLSGVVLQILTEVLDGGRILCRGLAATEPTLLFSKNRVRPYLLGTTFVIRKLFELRRGGMDELTAKLEPPTPYSGRQPLYRKPTNAPMSRFLLPSLARKAIARPFQRDTVGHWRIALRADAPLRFERGVTPDLAGFRWIESPGGRYYADPFLLEHHGEVYCFFEDFDYSSGRGRISVGRVTENCDLQDVRPILEPPFHLSYPFVFRERDEVYMIPESKESDTVDLYRAAAFPDKWEKVATIVPAPCKDTTLVAHDGYYWLFTSISEPAGAADQLLLMYSRSLSGPYELHSQTPISADARYARCGGRIANQDGALLRPAQDATGTYGSALHFRRIDQLSPTVYAEHTLTTIRPPKGFQGLHAYDRTGRFEVIDGKTLEPLARHRPG